MICSFLSPRCRLYYPEPLRGSRVNRGGRGLILNAEIKLQMNFPAAPQAGSPLCSDKLLGILAKVNKYIAGVTMYTRNGLIKSDPPTRDLN